MRCARRNAGRFFGAVRRDSLLGGKEHGETAPGIGAGGRPDAATAKRALPVRAGAGEGGRRAGEFRRRVRRDDCAGSKRDEWVRLRSALCPRRLRADVRPTDRKDEDEFKSPRPGAEEVYPVVQGESVVAAVYDRRILSFIQRRS